MARWLSQFGLETPLHDLDAIADYIVLDDPQAASRLVQRVSRHVEQLVEQRESGSQPPEMRQSRVTETTKAPNHEL